MNFPSRPRILMTNDDGIHAPGIKHLWEALKNYADITIIAPSTEQSTTGLSITTRQPLHIKKFEWPETTQAWSVSGTPADCVKMALSVILDTPPHFIISGINCGTNAGRNILYSGTVGGAIEGTLHHIPSLAFSCSSPPEFASAEKYIPTILTHVIDHPLPEGTLLNINFPPNIKFGIKGFKMTRQGKEFLVENPLPSGESSYWLGSKIFSYNEVEDCDINWLRQNYITAVPVHIGELTDHHQLHLRKTPFENLGGFAP